MKDWERKMAEWEKSNSGKEPIKSEEVEEVKEEEVDDMYGAMSKRQLEAEIDFALDNEDFELVKKLSIIKQKKYPE